MKIEKVPLSLNAEGQQQVLEYMQRRRQVQELLNPYKPQAHVYVNPDVDTPFRTVHVGDTHFGHDDSKPEALDEAIQEVGTDGLMVLQGNIVDGVSNKFISTNTTRIGFNLDEQEAIVRHKLRHVIRRNQVVASGKNTCHEGWSDKTATHDVTRHLVGPETPLVYTGGQVVFHNGASKVGSVEIYHNAGKGRTKQSPEGSVRERSREAPVGSSDNPDAIIDAHMHQLTAAQDVKRNPITRKDVVTALGEVSASKGSKDNPDMFLIGLGVPPRMQPADSGQGLVLIWKKQDDETIKPYPIAGYDRARVMYSAEKLLENMRRTGSDREFKEMILESQKGKLPQAVLDHSRCLVRQQDNAAKSEGLAPLYKTLAYDIAADLPVKIQFLANLRTGSTSLEQDKLRAILDTVNADPWSFAFATRRLLNQGTAHREDRETVLSQMTTLLAHGGQSFLGLMLTDELRSKAWRKRIHIDDEVTSEGLYPGDWIHNDSPIQGTPLIMPETVVFADVGKTPYTMYLRDGLSHFNSLINPYHGLTRVQQVWGIDADVLVGGNTEVVGWRTWMRPWGQLEVVVPGGFAEYAEKGIGNRVDYPTGGQGVIMFPENKMLFSFATHKDGLDMHQAVWMQEGLKKIGKLKQASQKNVKRKVTR